MTEQNLNGQLDDDVIDACNREQRALVTLDLDFFNILAYPPAQFSGIIVLRLADQAHPRVEAAIRRVTDILTHEAVKGILWVVEENRTHIRG